MSSGKNSNQLRLEVMKERHAKWMRERELDERVNQAFLASVTGSLFVRSAMLGWTSVLTIPSMKSEMMSMNLLKHLELTPTCVPHCC
jgi:hypothetical protein